MMKGFLHNKPYYVQFIFLLFLAMASLAVFFSIGFILIPPLFGINIFLNQGILADYNNPEVIAALKMLQIIQAFALFILPAVLFPYFVGEQTGDYLKTNKSTSLLLVILVISIGLISSPFMEFTAQLNAKMHLPSFLKELETWMRAQEDNLGELTKTFLKMNNVGALLINLVMIAVLPAIGEEFLFRGVLQRIFIGWSKNVHAGIIITAVLFSAMHIQFYGFIPRMLLGVLFGYLFYWSNSIWLPVLAHFLNNGTVVVFSYLFQNKITKFNIDSDVAAPAGVYMFSLLATMLLLFGFYTVTRKRILK
ncbi:CPBP family intramembrane glutamic endopeptidase [Solitalea koreensis]|uniref:CAAX prenyl protease 2/Lysostaphin resistance protein A-like domain-containing protein n=1 Tax=Solitalea koreensis TaxID=543615 RepID=A0A521C1J2_9SPHI|nr:CPBP family intramembrane glutamic endopeptidase [Solitalea koreensis]SMO53205.1 hypothetical protein SAMN06265350_103110 [Solitalea koreensis]